MNYVDIILLLVVALAIWGGWQKGFILGTINLLVWIGSLVVGFFCYKYLGVFLERIFPSLGVWTLPLAFLLTIILARLLLAFVFNAVLRKTPETAHRHGANRVMGLIPGLLNGLIYATILAAILLSVPMVNGLTSKTRESEIAGRLAPNAGWIDDKLSPIFSEAVKQSLTRVTPEPETDETVDLNFKVAKAKPRADLESQMLQLVNEERTKRGLKPLKADPELVPVARAHSQDMFARGYFSHYTPEGKDPFDRMKAVNIKYLTAGENLALGQTLRICHDGLMKSPGHRANILNPAYGRLGIGIMDGGAYGLMISQEFRN
ncbi:MAG TPA: CvpA family protein [Flavisolibacter sp.]|nr:CvpA family protein [Flavisolibacter sp.]